MAAAAIYIHRKDRVKSIEDSELKSSPRAGAMN
jgi:hypothetical protein